MRSRLLAVVSAASLCACGGPVVTANSPPTLNAPAAVTIDEGATRTVELSATDPDGDALSFSLTSAPAFVTLAGSTLTLSPGFSDSGAYSVGVQVSDGKATASGSFSLTVGNVNRPPAVDALSPVTMSAGTVRMVSIVASDPDGDTVTLALGAAAPSWAALSGSTLTLSPAAAGDVTISLTASDGQLSATGSVDVHVTAQQSTVSGTISIEAGAQYTRSGSVTLTLTGSSSAGTVTQMRFSNDGVTFSAFEPFATTRAAWALDAPGADGTKTVTVELKDSAGATFQISDTIVLDATPPNLSAFSVAAGASAVGAATVQLSVTAADALSGVQLYEASNDAATFVVVASPFDWVLSPGDGTKTVTLRVTDGAGNSAMRTDDIVVDLKAPTLGSAAINAGASWTQSTSVTVATTGASDAMPGSGLAQLCVSGAGAAPSPQCHPYGTGSATFTLSSGDGTKAIAVYVVDGVGLPSPTKPASIGLDATPPTLTSIDINAGATSTMNPLLSIASVASDGAGGSGVVELAFAEDSGAFGAWLPWTSGVPNAYAITGANGAHVIHAKVRDVAGNESGEATDSITLSGAPPSGTFVIGSGDPPYTRTQTVTLVISATAATHWCANESGTPPSSASDPCWKLLSSTSFDLSANDGAKTVSMWFKDSSGTISSMPATDAITLDATPPTLTIAASMLGIAQGAAYTASLSPTFDHSASDATSGLLDVCTGTSDPPTTCVPYTAAPALALLAGDGPKTGYVLVHDRAGNPSAVVSDTITLDQTPPTLGSISINAGAASAMSPASTVTLTGASDGSGSGLATVELSNDGSTFTGQAWAASVPWALSSGDGTKTVTARLVDAAGNRSVTPYATDDIVLDQAAPTATLDVNGGQRYANTASVPLTLTPSESTSGLLQAIVVQLASAAPPATPSSFVAFSSPSMVNIGGAQGDKKIYVWLKDAAGNVSPAPAVYVIGFDTVAPTATASSPANAATGVPRTTRPAVTFSEPLDPATVTAATLTISGGVTGTVTYDAATSRVYLVPSLPLAASTTYMVTVTGVKDRAGNALAAPYMFSFTTGSVVRISSDTPPGFTAPSIVTNGAGTLMMWLADDGLPTNDKAALYWAFNDGTSWRTGSLGRGWNPQVLTWGNNQFAATWGTGCCTKVFGLFDTASATWSLQTANQGTLFGAPSTRLYDLIIPSTGTISGHFFDTNTKTWSTVAQQASPVGTGFVPAAGTATSWAIEYLSFIAGNTYAVWLQRNSGGSWSTSQLTTTTGFPGGLGLVSNGTTFVYTYQSTAVIDTGGVTAGLGNPAILATTDGAGFLVASYGNNVLGARISNGTSWLAGGALFSASVPSLTIPTVKASGSTGHWALTWMQGTNLLGSVYDGASWSTPATIASGSMVSPLTNVSQASLGGNHLVAWTQDSESWASGWDGTKWTPPVKLDTQPQSGPHTVAALGASLAVFFGQNASMVVRTWQPMSGFSAPATILTSLVTGACNNYQGWGPPVSVAFAPNGKGLATWMQFDTNRWTVRAAYFDGSGWGAPFLVAKDALIPRVTTNGTTWVISWMRATSSGGQLSAFVTPWTLAGGVGATTDLGGIDYGAQLASDGAGFMAATLKGSFSAPDVLVASSPDGITWTPTTIEPAVSASQGWSNVALSGSSLGYALAYKSTLSGAAALARTTSGGVWSASASLQADGICLVASGTSTHAALCRASSIYNGYVLSTGTWGSTSFGFVSGGGGSIASAGSTFRVAFGTATRLYTSSWGGPETTGSATSPTLGVSGTEYATVGVVTSNGYQSVRAASSSGGVMADRGFIEGTDGTAYSPIVAGNGSGYWSVWSQDDLGGSNSIYGVSF